MKRILISLVALLVVAGLYISTLNLAPTPPSHQVFVDDDIGSIEPEKLANLVVLSGSPLTAPDLRKLLLDMTLIEGVTHFE